MSCKKGFIVASWRYMMPLYECCRYEVMLDCWRADPEKRPTFTCLREGMRMMLEHITEDYYYMGLNQARDYYNAAYQQDEFVDPPETPGPVGQEADPAPTTNSAPPSPTDTISFDSSGDNASTLDNNVFDGPPTPPLEPAPSKEGAPKADMAPGPSTSGAAPAPPLPPRLKPRRLTSVGGESITSMDESVCASPSFMALRRLDSTSSDQALLSPAFFGEKPPKFFKFTPSTKLTPLPELTPIPASGSDRTHEELKRESVLDQRVERETSPTPSPVTPGSPNNYFQSLLPTQKK